MIRTIAHYENGLPLVMLGLDSRTLDDLAQGKTIKVNLMRLGGLEPIQCLPDIDVAIFLTSADRTEVLRQLGAARW